MTTKRAQQVRLLLAYATVYVVWGSTYLAIRVGIATLPPFVLAGARFLLAGAALFAWAAARGAARPTLAQWRDATVIGGLMLLGGNGGVSWAEMTVPSGIAALIVATVPVFTVIFQRKRPALATVAGILLGFTGIGILVGPGALGEAGRVDPTGAAVLVAASASWALGSIYSLRADRPASGLQSAAMQMLAGGGLLTLLAALTGQIAAIAPASVSSASLAALAYLAVFGSILGFTAYTWLLRNTTPDRAVTYAYVNPVVAVLLGSGFAAEPLTWRVALAAAVIIAGVVLIVRKRRAG
jgi:drug/metabolite transporter (DMT)-like permease